MARNRAPSTVVAIIHRTAPVLLCWRNRRTTLHIVIPLRRRRPVLSPVTATGSRGWFGGGQNDADARETRNALISPAKSITSEPMNMSTPRVGSALFGDPPGPEGLPPPNAVGRLRSGTGRSGVAAAKR